MNVLVFAPHPDDEVLGCGGTIARYISEGHDVYVCVVTSGHPPIYEKDYKIAQENGWPHVQYPDIMKAHSLLGINETFFLQFPTVMLETVPRYELNGKINELVHKLKPKVVYIPHFGDMQRDHSIVSEAVMVAVRPKYEGTVRYVYSYETLSETEWNIPHVTNAFIPNTFIDIEPFLDKKKEAMSCFTTQICDFPNPRSNEAVDALAKLRGSTMGAKAAEGLTICLGILALYLFEKKNYILFALIAVFACSIHTSASVVIIAMIVFRIKCVASKKLVPALLITTVVLYFGTGLTTYIFNSVLKYSALSKYLDLYSGITSESSYGIGFFLLVVQYSLMIYFLREESYNISNEERTLILLSYIAFLVRPFTAVGAALITRLGYYFSVFDIVVMPLMFSKLRNKIIRILFVIILVVLIFYSYVQFWNSPVYIRSYEKFHTIFEAFR